MSTACNLCGRMVLQLLETACDGVRTVQCAHCGLIFLDPFPQFDGTLHYDADYYRPWVAEQGPQRRRLWASRVALLHRFSPAGRLLDVGCGEGSFLLAAREAGWRVAGTEVSRWAAQMLRETQGLEIHEGELLHIADVEPGFDVITMWHVLEHMEQPLHALRRARELLTADGTLIVAVPNSGFSFFRVVYPLARFHRLRYYTPGERELHLHHFTQSTLHALLSAAGFRVVYEGIDASALRPVNILLEKCAQAVQTITGACWSEALLAIATSSNTR